MSIFNNFRYFCNFFLKKSQISVFIIIGLLILITFSLFFYVSKLEYSKLETQIPETLILSDNIRPVQVYFESCIEQLSEKPITQIGLNGGNLYPLNYRYYNEEKYNYYCLNQYGFGCISNMILKEDMQRQISMHIENNFQSCANLNFFELQGFKIDKGHLSINTVILKNEVKIKAHYPITFTKDDKSLSIDYFSSSIKVPLGELYDLSIFILNSELKKDHFNQVDYMVNYNFLNNNYNDNNLIIKKHKPHPDIIYNLIKDDYYFNFALQGSLNLGIEKLFFSQNHVSSNGCCYIPYDNTCFVNVPNFLCEIKNGVFDSNSNCNCAIDSNKILNEDLKLTTLNANNCNNTYNYVTDDFSLNERIHGESWCSYDSLAGNGKDYVGSRHYMHYCIDGVEYVEECRDYRQEICVSTKINESNTIYSKAMCKPNRWEDCHLCDSFECCNDNNYRDCIWQDNLSINSKCVPLVPPGFKHWEGESREFCSIANNKDECIGFSCNDSWVSDNSYLCYMQGDCGNYRNIFDEKTSFGFFHTDLKAIVNDSIFPNKGFTTKGNNQFISFNYSSFNRQKVISSNLNENYDILSGVLVSFYSFLDQLSKISSNVKKDDFKVTNFAFCNLWQAPFENIDCSKCDGGYFRPCTEYKCKSISQQCIYEEIKGKGYCMEREDLTNNLPIITLNDSLTEKSLRLEEKEIILDNLILRGYKVKENLSQNQIINIGINTKKETTCKMSFIPKNNYVSLMSNPIGNNSFVENHLINLRIPPKPKISTKIFDIFDSKNISSFLNSFYDLQSDIFYQKNENELLSDIFSIIFGNSIFDDNAKKTSFINLLFDNSLQSRQILKLLLEKINNGGYYAFIYCMDRAGQENIHPFFIEIDIDDSFMELNPPKILGIIPKNNSLFSYLNDNILIELFLNEPSDCRYSLHDVDFFSMNNSFECVNSNNLLSPQFGGSYSCKTKYNTSKDDIKLFIRCKDLPTINKEVDFKLYLENETKLEKILFNDFLINQNNFSVSKNNMSLYYYLDDNYDCNLILNSSVTINGSCNLSNKKQLGLYECIFKQDFSKINFNNLDNNYFLNSKIVCKNNNSTNFNVHNESIVYKLNRSNELKIVDFKPKGDIYSTNPTLYVKTTKSNNVKCGFFNNKNLGVYSMENIVDFEFSTKLVNLNKGSHTYFVNCFDSYGNEALKEIDFYIN
ncbi:MAG: hypothetical protein ACOC3X_03095 [Nanoarchaeota archaeon]